MWIKTKSKSSVLCLISILTLVVALEDIARVVRPCGLLVILLYSSHRRYYNSYDEAPSSVNSSTRHSKSIDFVVSYRHIYISLLHGITIVVGFNITTPSGEKLIQGLGFDSIRGNKAVTSWNILA